MTYVALSLLRLISIHHFLARATFAIDRGSMGGFRRRALLELYSTRINYLTLKTSKCRLVRLWLD